MGDVLRFPRHPARASTGCAARSPNIRSSSTAAIPVSGGPSVSHREIVAWSTPKRPANVVWLSRRLARAAFRVSPVMRMGEALCISHSPRQCPTHTPALHSALMESPEERLQRAHKLAGYETAADAARALDVPYPTFVAHTNGSRGFKAEAERYAAFFRVSLEWLMTGRGEPRAPSWDAKIANLSPDRQGEIARFYDYLMSQDRSEHDVQPPAPARARRRN